MPASDALTTGLQALLTQHALPASYLNAIEPFLLPIAEYLALRHKQTEKALIWGVCGSQGSGKTTLVQFLQCLLRLQFGLTSVCLSLDDFYHSREQRQLLARIWHPLFTDIEQCERRGGHTEGSPRMSAPIEARAPPFQLGKFQYQ